ncbi:MAG TPA: hypothetical protein VMV39_03095 [Terracidiphilus sp.]|nr:hypothetical protein [Terracidiphilus sp.]
MEDLVIKAVQLLAVAMVTVSSIPFMAQHVGGTTQQSASASAMGNHASESAQAGAAAHAGPGRAQANGAADGAVAANQSGRANAAANGSAAGAAQTRPVELRPVTGELQGKLDSKTARPGDRVVLKTEQRMKTADGVFIPKGSRLIGHVTEVQAHGSGHAASQVGIVFDRAQLKGGQSFAIHSMIESVQPSPAAIAARAMENEGAFAGPAGAPIDGGGAMAGGAMMGGAGAAGVGRMGGGGLVGGTVGGAAAATGGPGSDLGPTAGGAMRTTDYAAGETGALARGVHGRMQGVASGAGTLGAHATGIPGVMLDSSASGSASGMLSAAKRNVHLDSGTQMVLGIATVTRQ